MKKINIKYLMLLLSDLFVVAFAAIFAFKTKSEVDGWKTVLGVLIILSSLPHLCLFVLQGGIKNKKIAPFFGFAVAGFLLGLFAIYLKEFSLDQICLCWGIFDICRSSFEIYSSLSKSKKIQASELTEIFVSVGEIVIAIFLIVDRFEGIRLHIIALFISFIIYTVKNLVELVVGDKIKND